jgi:hypothetical protein
MLKTAISFLTIISTLKASFLIGAGGFDVSKKEGVYSFKNATQGVTYTYITEVLAKKSPNVNSVTIWITRNWKEKWFRADEVQKEIIDKGYTPVFIFYYFGDAISPKYIHQHEKEYFKQLQHFTRYLKKLKGQKIVILNPEYNMFGCEKLKSMNDIFLKSFRIVRQDPQVLVGPCVGDFGNYDFVNEPKEWKLFHPSIYKAAKAADFIAFQEMRGLTRNSPSTIKKTAQRAYHLAQYLHKTYKKPTMLAYLAVSSYGDGGKKLQADVYKDFVKLLPKMQKEAQLLFFGTFHYFDYPGHVGYFREAEEFFGVLQKDGTPKPSFIYFNKLH